MAVAGHAPTEMCIGEHCDTRFVEQTPPKLLRIRASGDAAGFRDVRPRIECATRRTARDAGHIVQQSHDEVAPLQKRLTHRFRGILWSRYRLERGPLAYLRSA